MILDLGWIGKQIIETKMALSTSFGVVFAPTLCHHTLNQIVSFRRSHRVRFRDLYTFKSQRGKSYLRSCSISALTRLVKASNCSARLVRENGGVSCLPLVFSRTHPVSV